ncbi:MAG TPA: hypothetical protein VH165_08040 [Kofleriaceae bacterium]|jgi:hypothetical protein|nr:hypothetical protein [Kofleriaceae bacterium]
MVAARARGSPIQQGQDPAQATWKLMASGSADKFNPRNLRTIALVVTYATKLAF